MSRFAAPVCLLTVTALVAAWRLTGEWALIAACGPPALVAWLIDQALS